MRTKISVALTVLLICISSACYASETDRWEWIMSTDVVDCFFDKETIRYGTKDEWNSTIHRYQKIVDKTKIVVYTKTVYTDEYRAYLIDYIVNHGGTDTGRINNTEYAICKEEFDYANSHSRIMEYVSYDINGNVISKYNNIFTEWNSLLPGSIGEKTAKLIREYAEKNYDKIVKNTLQ